MADQYVGPFYDMSAFVADGNAINAATKTALNTALTNFYTMFDPPAGTSAAHPDFSHITPNMAKRIVAEIGFLKAAITAHA